MKTIQTSLPDLKTTYPLETMDDLDKILFLDIETTGFSAKTSYLYLIGCVYWVSGEFQLIQWFAESYEEEREVLLSFLTFSRSYTTLVHFNGNNFDLPYLSQKAAKFLFPCNFGAFNGIDIYKRIAPYKEFLKLPNCKQKTLETFLNIKREDSFQGNELIGIYHDYVKSPSEFFFHALLLHNSDDIQGMVSMLPILSYVDLFHEEIQVTRVQANHYKDIDGQGKQELLMKCKLPSSLPIRISYHTNGCYFTGFEKEGTLKVPILEGELKYFYANYKDYYYLPAEDIAMHKSVASFVESKYKVKANASTCYTKKLGLYLPQWEILFEPFFKKDYNQKDCYFELTEEIKKDRTVFHKYASHILCMML